MDCSDGYFQNGVASKNFSSSKSSYFSIEIWPIAGDISPLIGAPLQLHSFYLLPFRLLHSLWYFGINMESGKYEPNYTLLTYQPSTCHLPKNIGTVLVSPKKVLVPLTGPSTGLGLIHILTSFRSPRPDKNLGTPPCLSPGNVPWFSSNVLSSGTSGASTPVLTNTQPPWSRVCAAPRHLPILFQPSHSPEHFSA